MIKIENINITYDKPLILNGTLEIPDGKITVIKGPSGIGKSSLLSIAGLLKKSNDLIYIFNQVTISNNDKTYAEFRKNHIGYVFQENDLFEHLSIYENLKLFCTMVGTDLTHNKAKELLSLVHLDKDIFQTTTTLSGGEKQRLAIACAISKQPELLILDEPTSALDKKNSQILIDTLKDLTKQNMMILIASHDENLINQCDNIYEIRNQQLILLQNCSISEKQLSLKPKQKRISFSFYIRYALQYLKQYIFFHSLSFFVLSVVIACMIGFPSILKKYNQISNINHYNELEVFISYALDGKYDSQLCPIDEWQIEQIKKMPDVKYLYPFYEAQVIKINNEDNNQYVIVPYYASFALSHNAYIISDNKQGIYCSRPMDIKELTFVMPDGKEEHLDNLFVSGILNENYRSPYSNSKNIIYVPYQLMPETTKIQALIAETKDDIGVGFVMYQMGTIDSQLIAKNEIMTKRSNTAKIDEMINTFAPSMTISMILMSILLIILVYSKYIENRQIEINLLRVNGLRKLEVVKVVIIELLIHALIIGISSTILLFVLYQIMQETLNTFLSFSMIQSFFISTIISLGLIFIPAFISLTIFQRQDIADIMRNH